MLRNFTPKDCMLHTPLTCQALVHHKNNQNRHNKSLIFLQKLFAQPEQIFNNKIAIIRQPKLQSQISQLHIMLVLEIASNIHVCQQVFVHCQIELNMCWILKASIKRSVVGILKASIKHSVVVVIKNLFSQCIQIMQ